jgi:hypothetical protein
MRTAAKAFGGVSSGSLKPKLPAVTVYAVSSKTVTERSNPLGGWFAGAVSVALALNSELLPLLSVAVATILLPTEIAATGGKLTVLVAPESAAK